MKKAVFGLVAVLMVGLAAVSAFAFGPGTGKSDDLRTALEQGDYDAYIEAFDENDRPFMMHKLTEEEFNEDAERFQEREAHRAEMEAIMESGDYEAWKEHVAEMPRASMMAEQITEENFDTFVEMHNARVNGDHETAKELASELGIEKGRKGFGHGRGMRGCASPMAE